ncbi:MAG TPA: glycosyltransferase family 2 protein, partial [Candidatus Limnocylindrales bacterium]|nr:glycosyltransferase family 2 protein [Candidatus Limnocylindrales bacterium]
LLSAQKVTEEALKKSLPIPHFSVMIPARDEAEVIANTIEHLTALNYPHNQYEIVVITDGKELDSKKNDPNKITTQDVVEEKIREFATRNNVPALKNVVVPYDFEGRINGICLGREVTSTKARALNYGLQFICTKTTICSFFDAESRPEKNILLHLANRYIATSGKQKLWQGPVFQVRNFYQLGPFNKVIALYQALAHEWYLPILMRHIPFLGGTNLHVEHDLLLRIGGYDHTILSEDLELGVRAYLETNEWPEYIPIVSTEQTPATYKAYYRQRLRWASGHLQVFDKLDAAKGYPNHIRKPLLRALYWKGHAQWYLYQALALVPLIFIILTAQGDVEFSIIPEAIRSTFALFTPLYFSFTFYLFYRYRKYINFSVAPSGFLRFLPALQLAVLPVVGFFIILPFTSALALRAMHRQPQVWVKTPRTQEVRAKNIS